MESASKSLCGLELARLYHHEVVQPIIRRVSADIRYSSALIGTGSEVLGFDSEMSRDHDWGPRLQLFLDPAHHDSYAARLDLALNESLPTSFRGYQTRFSTTTDEAQRHRIEIFTCRQYFLSYLEFDLSQEITALDWLSFPQQKLRSVISGAVFHDDLGLQQVRDRFAFYPRDVWLFILSCLWRRVGQEEHLAGRAGHRGDQLGSTIVLSRLVRDLMRICFLMERRYAPYPKWFGTAFSQLNCAASLLPALQTAMHAPCWEDREQALVAAYEIVVTLHNSLSLTATISPHAHHFFTRPYRVIGGEEIANALAATIADSEVKKLLSFTFGSIDLLSDSTDFVDSASARRDFLKLF